MIQYLFRTKEVMEENKDWLVSPEHELSDAEEAAGASCMVCDFVTMKQAIEDRFAPIAKSITENPDYTITVEYDPEKIEEYLLDLLASLSAKIELADIRGDYRCVYDIEGWDFIEDEGSYVYDNISACTGVNTYIAHLFWNGRHDSDTFDKAFVLVTTDKQTEDDYEC